MVESYRCVSTREFTASKCAGMVLITVAYGLRVLLWSRDGHLKSRASINWVMVGATLAMFTIATMEMAFGFQHNLQAFILYTGPGGPNAEFNHISNWVNVMKTVDYVAQTFIGDAIMVCIRFCMSVLTRTDFRTGHRLTDATLCMTGTGRSWSYQYFSGSQRQVRKSF